MTNDEMHSAVKMADYHLGNIQGSMPPDEITFPVDQAELLCKAVLRLSAQVEASKEWLKADSSDRFGDSALLEERNARINDTREAFRKLVEET